MDRELVIGISGHAGVGKTTVANILAPLVNAQIFAFADALKDDIQAFAEDTLLKEISREEMENLKGEIFGPILQGYGAMMRHYEGPDYWIERWSHYPPDRVIVPDVRHLNEAEYIKSIGGYHIHIVGVSRHVGDTRSMHHESERFVDEVRKKADHVIFNIGSLELLHRNAKDALKKFDIPTLAKTA